MITGPDGFSATGVQSSLSFVPTEVGTYLAQLTVTDANNGIGIGTKNIAVGHLQPQPILNFVGLNPDNSVNLDAKVPDPGSDDQFTYSVTLSGGTFIKPTPGTTDFTFTIPAIGSSTVVGVSVTDTEGGSASASTTILVIPPGTTKNLTSSDVGSSSELLALASGNDTVSAVSLPSSVTVELVAVGSHNTLIGGPGTNILRGDSGFNLLEGGSGPNTFFGSSSDTLQGGSGTNNFLLLPPTPNVIPMSVVAGSGSNTIDLSQQTSGINLNLTTGLGQVIGGSGTLATLSGAFQNVVGSLQADLITAAGNMSVFGSGGNDTLQAINVSNVSLIAGSGNTSLFASGGSNLLLQGGIGTDTLTAVNVNNASLFGGSGSNDSLSHSGGSNITLFGGSGSNDSLSSLSGTNVTLIGGSGSNDSLSHMSGSNITLFGGSGSNDTLSSVGGANVTMFGGSGSNDSLTHTSGSNITLFGGSGSNDTLSSVNGTNVTLFGGSGSNDWLSHTSGSNITLFGGSGSNDTLSSVNGSNVTLIGGSGSNDSLSHASGSNITLFGGSGSNDTLSAVNGTNVSLIGGSGSNDSLSHTSGSNITLFGGSGSNDTLSSVNGTNVTLIGGSGSNDSLSHMSGSNVTLFGGSGSNDTLASMSGSNVTLIGGSGSNDSLSSTGGVNVTLIGGSGSNDTLSANGGSNVTLFGGSGSNDSLSHVSGSNITLFGGSGSHDSLSSTSGTNVTLIGGSGSNDTLSATGGSNITLTGGSGSNDSLSHTGGSNITLFGGSGSNDTLASMGGNNVSLIGGSGSNDSLSHASGSNITLFGGSGSNDTLSAVGGTNVTLFGGSGTNDSLASTSGHNVTLFGGSGDGDHLTDASGTNMLLIGGSGSKDSLSSASGTNVTLFGGSGSNDSLSHMSGSNITLFGGSGSNDTLASMSGSNVTLIGGSGSNDSLSAVDGIDVQMIGGSGSNDTLSHLSGSNITLFGGSGSHDSLSSTSGTNVTLIGGSGSNDTLSASGSHNVTLFGGSGSNDSLSSSSGLNVSLFGGSGDNDLLTDKGSTNLGIIGGSGSHDTLTSSSGTNVTLFGGSGDNDSLSSTSNVNVTLFGGSGNNDTLMSVANSNITLFGGSGGNDSLYSTGDSNATLIGGSGSNDTLQAVNDDPTTLINGGFGVDFFEIDGGTDVAAFGGFGADFLTANGGTNIQLYGEDGNNTYKLEGSLTNPLSVSLDDLATIGLQQSPNDRQTSGANTIEFPTASGIHIDLSQFSQGTTNQVSSQAVAAGISLNLVGEFENVVGTPGNDFIKGNGVDNVLTGVSGNDTLVGGSGNSTLQAGSGNDTFIGGTGHTTYLFSDAAQGQDVINQPNANNQDTLDLSQLSTPATVNLNSTAPQAVNPNLTLTFINPNAANVIGSPAGNTITGNGRDNQFTLSGGTNSLTGGGGFDTYSFTGSQLGNVTINDSPGSRDALNFHQFGQPISIDLNQNTQSTGGGTLTVNPLAVVDVVGTSFNDVIKGNNSASAPSVSMIGGGGLDSLVAGAGNDVVQAGLTQVVLLDFDTFTLPSDHVYSQMERDAIQQRLETIYADFITGSAFGKTGIVFTQSLTQAQSLSQPGRGQFVTIYFNRLPEGGLADEVDFRNLDLGGTASVDVNPILGAPHQPPATTQNYILLSANLAAHEFGHLLGLRHADSFGPIGAGAYEVFAHGTNQQLAGVNPSQYHPTFVEPSGVTPVSGNFTPDGGQTNTPADIFASETPLHVMASPASVGISRFDSLGNIFFGEREAIKLAFDETGVTLPEQTGSHQSFTTAQALGALPSLDVPNTLLSGSDFSKTFQVTALDVLGHIGLDPVTGHSEDDYFSFTGHQGDLMNFEVLSNVLSRIKHPIDSVLKIYDSAGNLLTMNDDEFESQDSTIIDFKLPANGVYFVVVDTFTPDGINDSITGDYELFMYSFATTTGAAAGSGSTLVAGSGHDTLLGGLGNDLFTVQVGSAGSASVMGGGGQDVVDQTPAPVEQVTIAPPILGATIQSKQSENHPPSLSPIAAQTINEGQLLHFSASATDADPGDMVTLSLALDPLAQFPSGATINPITGDFNWHATDEGAFGVRIIATDSSGQFTYQDIAISATDVAPAINSIPAQTINEGAAVSMHGSVSNPVLADTYSFSWTVTLGNQTVATGTGKDLSFTPGDEGSYNVQLTVTDLDDGTSSVSNTTVTVNDVAPTVKPIPSQTVNEGSPVSFTGSYSDPGTVDSQILDWQVVASNGQIIQDGKAPSFSFTPIDNGTYTVTFTVLDADGGPQGSTAAVVTVLNVPPTAILGNNGPVAEGSTATASFTNQFDPSPVDAATLHYSIAMQQSSLAPNYSLASSSPSTSFNGLEEGRYTVYGRIFDKDGGFTDYTTTLVVTDAQLIPVGNFSFSATEGATSASQTVATFTDPGGLEAMVDYTAQIAWGDGQSVLGAISYNAQTGVFTVQGSHLYAEDGIKTIKVTLTHDLLSAIVVTSTGSVADPPVKAAGNLTAFSAKEGSDSGSLTLATFTDPGGTVEPLADYSAQIAWGDGQTSTGVITVANGVFTVTGHHAYQEEGNDSITVTLGHDSATSVTVTDSMTVADPQVAVTAATIGAIEASATGLITVATFTDPGGAESTGYSATIDWGDKSTTLGAQIVALGDGKTFNVLGNHTYAEDGSYTLKVTVTHDSTTAVTGIGTAKVSDPAVVGSGTLTNVIQAVTYTNLAVATFVDPAGPEALTDYGATINWGDNLSSPGTIKLAGSSFTVTGNHIYTQAFGTLTVTVTLTHDSSPLTTVTETVLVGPSIIVLNSSASGSMTVSGSSIVSVKGSVVVDSNSSSALTVSGTSQITAANILVVGGVSITGTPILNPTPTHAASIPDPFLNVPAPSATGLTNQGSASFSTGMHTLNPGIYTQISVTNSASVVLNPGTYVIKGGGLTVSGSGSLSGSGLLIYNAGSNYPNTGGNFGGITVSNSGTVSLTAATTGTYANILIFQARDNNRAISFSGSVVAGISGEIYAKAALLSLTNSAALKLPVVVDRLTVSGAGTSGLRVDGSALAVDGSVGELVQGNLYVYVNDPAGYFTADDLARIQDTIVNLNDLLAPYSVTITELESTDLSLANVVIDNGITTPLGGQADGVLGTFTPSTGEITLVQGWNWYAGSDSAAIGPDQYDFETLVTHELGHALGLGHSPDRSSVMFPSLATGVTRRLLTVQDLNIGDPETIPGALMAAHFSRSLPLTVSAIPTSNEVSQVVVESMESSASTVADDRANEVMESTDFGNGVGLPKSSKPQIESAIAPLQSVTIFWNPAPDLNSLPPAINPLFANGGFPQAISPRNLARGDTLIKERGFFGGPGAIPGFEATGNSLNVREIRVDHLADAAIWPMLQDYSIRPGSEISLLDLRGAGKSQIRTPTSSSWEADAFFQSASLGDNPMLVALAVLTGIAAVNLGPEDLENDIL
jgi:Ca2+-binding RTX toxin-like protein